MLIKAYTHDGSWQLHEAESSVTFKHGVAWTDVEEKREDDWDFYHQPTPQGSVWRWVSWTDPLGSTHLLASAAAVYICNDSGDTVEALR